MEKYKNNFIAKDIEKVMGECLCLLCVCVLGIERANLFHQVDQSDGQ